MHTQLGDIITDIGNTGSKVRMLENPNHPSYGSPDQLSSGIRWPSHTMEVQLDTLVLETQEWHSLKCWPPLGMVGSSISRRCVRWGCRASISYWPRLIEMESLVLRWWHVSRPWWPIFQDEICLDGVLTKVERTTTYSGVNGKRVTSSMKDFRKKNYKVTKTDKMVLHLTQ